VVAPRAAECGAHGKKPARGTLYHFWSALQRKMGQQGAWGGPTRSPHPSRLNTTEPMPTKEPQEAILQSRDDTKHLDPIYLCNSVLFGGVMPSFSRNAAISRGYIWGGSPVTRSPFRLMKNVGAGLPVSHEKWWPQPPLRIASASFPCVCDSTSTQRTQWARKLEEASTRVDEYSGSACCWRTFVPQHMMWHPGRTRVDGWRDRRSGRQQAAH